MENAQKTRTLNYSIGFITTGYGEMGEKTICHNFVMKNQALPCEDEFMFYTYNEKAEYLKIRLIVGQSDKPVEVLTDKIGPGRTLFLPMMPVQGTTVSQIKVKLAVDEQGDLHVTMKPEIQNAGASAWQMPVQMQFPGAWILDSVSEQEQM